VILKYPYALGIINLFNKIEFQIIILLQFEMTHDSWDMKLQTKNNILTNEELTVNNCDILVTYRFILIIFCLVFTLYTYMFIIYLQFIITKISDYILIHIVSSFKWIYFFNKCRVLYKL